MSQPVAARSSLPFWISYGEPILGVVTFVVVLATAATNDLIGRAGANDFFVFLNSAHWLREGRDLYQHPLPSGPGYNLNPPAAVIAFLPLSFLPDALAFRVWTIVSIAAYVLTAFWIARAVARGRFVTVASIMMLSQPVIASLLLGQTSALLTLLMTSAWMDEGAERPWRAGLLLGIAVGLKPFLGLFLLYALWKRSVPMASGMLAGIAGTVVLGLMAGGVSGYRSWIAALGQISWTAHWLNASLLGLFSRTLSVTPEVLHMTPFAVQPSLVRPLWWAGVTAVVAIAARAWSTTSDRDRAWSLVVVTSLLISPLGWIYYVPVAAGPLVSVWKCAASRVRAVLAIAYALLLVPPLSVGGLGRFNTALFGSVYNWALLLLFAGVVCMRPTLPGGASARPTQNGMAS